jgi:hypothetical protein
MRNKKKRITNKQKQDRVLKLVNNLYKKIQDEYYDNEYVYEDDEY